jgi:hypothetical protein
MSKRPCNLSLDERVLAFAQRIMDLKGQSNLTAFVEDLIREEYERRAGPLVLREEPAPYQVNSNPPGRVETRPELIAGEILLEAARAQARAATPPPKPPAARPAAPAPRRSKPKSPVAD